MSVLVRIERCLEGVIDQCLDLDSCTITAIIS
uniref:Uncharacterized protein n=1 Tax=Arundo donax TaxID=35708 RepID=A0A0A9GMF9_ARUDO